MDYFQGGIVPRSTYVPQLDCLLVPNRQAWIDALNPDQRDIVITALEGPAMVEALSLIDGFLTRHERWQGEGDEQP